MGGAEGHTWDCHTVLSHHTPNLGFAAWCWLSTRIKKLDWGVMKSWLSGKRLPGLESHSLARLGLKQQNSLPVRWSCAQDWSCWCLFLCQGQHFPSPARGGWVEKLLLASSGAKNQERSLRLGGERLSGFPEAKSLWGWTGSMWSCREDKGIFSKEKSSSPPSLWGPKTCRAGHSSDTPKYCIILGICKCRI